MTVQEHRRSDETLVGTEKPQERKLRKLASRPASAAEVAAGGAKGSTAKAGAGA